MRVQVTLRILPRIDSIARPRVAFWLRACEKTRASVVSAPFFSVGDVIFIFIQKGCVSAGLRESCFFLLLSQVSTQREFLEQRRTIQIVPPMKQKMLIGVKKQTLLLSVMRCDAIAMRWDAFPPSTTNSSLFFIYFVNDLRHGAGLFEREREREREKERPTHCDTAAGNITCPRPESPTHGACHPV